MAIRGDNHGRPEADKSGPAKCRRKFLRLFRKGFHDDKYVDWERGSGRRRFENWVETVAALPRRQTRVLTWPLVTVFGFIGAPAEHFFLKPMVTRAAAREYGYDFRYKSKPSWEVYENLLEFAGTVSRDLRDLKPRDMIDIQSFLWVQGSDEYEE
ncbi:MAG: hypothetical protein H0T21_00710 [Gemmatimonadaceae bacterium]|nr:hypothetical protein [Gemmatimonadaceae bacterium]